MSTLQPKTDRIPRERDYQFWASRFALIIGLYALAYYSYCFGLWGKGSLLFQDLFQCGCPGSSEEWRYPNEVDIVVSACRNREVILSPSGRLLYVQQDRMSLESTYLLNLETGEKTAFVLPKGSNYLLTDDLVFHSFYGNDQYILDITTGMKYPIQDATHVAPNISSISDVEPNLLLEALSQVDQIFLVDDVFQPVIALSSDFRTHSENSFAFNSLDFPPGEIDSVRHFLQQNNIVYQDVPAGFAKEARSPDGRFIAREDGIYLIKTNQLIVKAHISGLRGWADDGRGVIYASSSCLFLFSLPGLDMTCLKSVHQPVILLKVPEEYLSSTRTP